MKGKRSLKQRLKKLVEIRTNEGYMAEVQAQADGSFLLVENHCPICAAATACTGLCAKELETFQSVLGDEVEIQRVEHIIAGARRCAYQICQRQRSPSQVSRRCHQHRHALRCVSKLGITGV